MLILTDELLACGLSDGSINIWNLNEKRILRSTRAHKHGVSSLAKANDSSKIISGSRGSTIKIWDTIQLNDPLLKITQHWDKINCLKMLGDNYFLSGSDDQTVRKWNIVSGQCIQTINLNRSVYCLAKLLTTMSFW